MVFIIDDDVSVCKAMMRLMHSAGLSVQTFTSAQVFLSSVQPKESDCLLVDIQMPGMNGLELQRQLTRSGIRVPVIFITAFDDEQMRKQARQGGAAGYFRKPFDDQALLDAIRFETTKT